VSQKLLIECIEVDNPKLSQVLLRVTNATVASLVASIPGHLARFRINYRRLPQKGSLFVAGSVFDTPFEALTTDLWVTPKAPGAV